MASIYKRGGKSNRTGPYYIAYTDANGVRQTLRGCADRQATEQLARKLEAEVMLRKRGVIDEKADQYAQAEYIPLSAHLPEYRAVQRAKGVTEKQVRHVSQRAARVIGLCKANRISDLVPSVVQRAIGTLRNEGVSLQTCNHYLQAIKQFYRWLWRDGRTRENALAHLTGYNVKLDRRHDRRALELDELRRLLKVTHNGPIRFRMSGPERAMLYRLAIETGLRASELRSLRVLSFDFDRCTVVVEAAYSKRRRQDVILLRSDTSAELREFLRAKTPNTPAFKMPDKYRVADMLQADLADADIPYVDDAGRYADFHALRHCTGTLLAVSGVHPKVAQTIMRHSTPELTLNRYSHVGLRDQRQALEGLPSMKPDTMEQEAGSATGTDNLAADRSAAHLQRAERPTEQCLSSYAMTKGTGESEDGKNKDVPNPLKKRTVSSKCQHLSTPAKGEKSTTPGGIRTHDLRFRKPLLYPG